MAELPWQPERPWERRHPFPRAWKGLGCAELLPGKECSALAVRLGVAADTNPAGSTREGVVDLLSGSWGSWDLCVDGGARPATVRENQNQEQSSEWGGMESTGKNSG